MPSPTKCVNEGEARVKTISKPPLMRENNLPQVTEHFTATGRLFAKLTVRESASPWS